MGSMQIISLILPLVIGLAIGSNLPATDIQLEREGDVVHVTVDGKPFTDYLANSGRNPALWPVIGPTGVEMTRAYPFRVDVPGEKTDHPHHRSLWFSHGDVDGVNYWNEPSEDFQQSRGFGRIVHREFLKIQSGDEPLLMTRNEWLNSRDEKQLTDYRTVAFGADDKCRWIDFDIRLVNDGTEPVKIGDTKEGTFAVRVAGWLRGDAGGTIVNNAGVTDKDTWGKAASWVDYHGEHEGQRLGIAILNHPSSFRFPTFWHVRTYGLFAANVFGLHNFKNSEDEDGSYVIQPGESLIFCYRVLLHQGDEQEGRVPELFVDYAKVDKTLETEKEFTKLLSEPTVDTP